MELTVTNSGVQSCPPNHSWGPLTRKCYLFHFILSGSGVFKIDGHAYHLGAGQGFFVCPGKVCFYQADKKTPWEYAWVGFNGGDAHALFEQTGLSSDYPLFTTTHPEEVEKCLRQIFFDYSTLTSPTVANQAAIGGVLRLLAYISRPHYTPDEAYCEKALWFIRAHLYRPIPVEEIAAFVHLSRSQLFRVIKKSTGSSPQAIISRERAIQARQLLEKSDLSIPQIALSCGYANAAHFSTAYKRATGHTPTQTRQSSE